MTGWHFIAITTAIVLIASFNPFLALAGCGLLVLGLYPLIRPWVEK